MKAISAESTRWAAELSRKFRLLQSSFADDLPDARKQALDDELERVLKAVPLSKRTEYMEALAAEFPLPDGAEPRSAAQPPAAPQALPDDPTLVVEHLVNLLRTLPPEQTAVVARQLQDAGLLPANAAATGEISPELQEQIQKFAPNRVLNNTRALRTLEILMEFTLNLDQLVWQVWRSIAPRSVIKHESGTYREFRKTLAAYLTGDSEVSTEQIKQIVGKARTLICGLVAAMGNVGEIHAAKFLDRLSPDAIERAAKAETGGYLDSTEKKCWKRYTLIYNELNREAIEKEILDGIRKYTERLVLGAEVVSTLED